ncbi:MAG: rplO [Parachlamydiales bacterium]|nr:rplO [Parachlamydiales bacterium]
MVNLAQLKNTSRPKKKIQRVGRGIGSKRGATSGRGTKGDGSRRGYSRRYGYEGGQVPLYRKLPVRGFTRGRFDKASKAITFSVIEKYFTDGETVNYETLREKGLVPRVLPGGIKLIGTGELTKKVRIEVHAYTAGARQKLEEKSIAFLVVEK